MSKHIAIWISSASLLVSITALCIAAYRTPNLTFDYQGVLVGILAALVTILIGWNIYTLIDIRAIREKMKQDQTIAYIQSENNLSQTYLAISDYFYSTLAKENQPENERIYKYILYRVSTILHASKIKDIKTCEAVVKALLQTIHPENIQTTAKNKQCLFDLLANVENAREISQFAELLQRLASMKVSDNAETGRSSRP